MTIGNDAKGNVITVRDALNAQYGFLDSTGRVVIEPRFDMAWRFQPWNALLGFLAGVSAFIVGPIIAGKIVELQMLPVPTLLGNLTRSGRRNAEINQLVEQIMRPLTQGIWGFLTGACSNVPEPGN